MKVRGHRARRRPSRLLFLCLLWLALPGPGPILPVTADQRELVNPRFNVLADQKRRTAARQRRHRAALANPKARLLVERKKRRRLERGLAQQNRLVDQAERKERDLLAELDEVNAELSRERRRRRELEERLTSVEAEIASLNEEIDELEHRRHAARAHVRRRLAALYTTGGSGLLNILFSSRSLGDLEDDREYYQRLVAHDRAVLADYRRTLDRLSAKRAELERQRAALAGLTEAVRRQEERLEGARRRQQRLLARIRTEKHLYERALTELRAAAERLQRRIADLANLPAGQPAATPSPTAILCSSASIASTLPHSALTPSRSAAVT